MTTYEEAIDLMYGAFKTAWDAEASGIIGYTPEVEYEGVRDNRHAKGGKAFARLSVRNVIERQATLGSPGGAGKHEYETIGLMVVQLFLPKSDNTAMVSGRRLAQLVRNTYRSVSAGGEVWFRDATIREQPPGNRWYQINVTIEYNFMETV